MSNISIFFIKFRVGITLSLLLFFFSIEFISVNADTVLKKGVDKLNELKITEAMEEFKKIKEQHPHNFYAHKYYIYINHKLGNYHSLIEEYKKLHEKYLLENKMNEVVSAHYVFLHDYDVDLMHKHALDIFSFNPKTILGKTVLAVSYLVQRDFSTAKAIFDTIDIKKAPEYTKFVYAGLIRNIANASGKTYEAKIGEQYLEAISILDTISPDNFYSPISQSLKAEIQLGFYSNSEDVINVTSGLTILDEITQKYPYMSLPYSIRARFLIDINRKSFIKSAMNNYNEVLKRDRGSPYDYNDIAWYTMKFSKKKKDREKCIDYALIAHKNSFYRNANIMHTLAECYYSVGQCDKATSLIKSTKKLVKSNRVNKAIEISSRKFKKCS